MEITMIIPGKPVGKGRPRFTSVGMAYTPKRTVEYENLVRLAWMQTDGAKMMTGNIKATIKAYFSMPTSWSKKKMQTMCYRPYPHKPDIDNLCKSICDSLNGLAYKDDSQIVEIQAVKLYGKEPMAIVTLKEVDQ